ncbi:MAG: hypothetical protein LUE14_07940 [Clostridiales bacterium]|nr:hypothetical protein [Clostridiales bacterium]
MAKIRNVSIKALKEFEGTEGSVVQGNLYIGGKKVAFWSQDGDGGVMDRLDMEPDYSGEKLRNLFSDSSDGVEAGFERFMDRLAILTLEERDFKKESKKGFGVMVRKSTESCVGSVSDLFISAEYSSMANGEIQKKFRDEINKMRVYRRRGETPKIEVVRSLKEFNIPGGEIQPEDIAE